MSDIYVVNNERYEVGPNNLDRFLSDFPDAVLQEEKQAEQKTINPPKIEKIFLTGDDMDYVKYPFLKGTEVEKGLYFKTNNQLRNKDGNIVVDFRTEEEVPQEERLTAETQFQEYKTALESGDIEEEDYEVLTYKGGPYDPVTIKYPTLKNVLKPGDTYYRKGNAIYTSPAFMGEEDLSIATLDYSYGVEDGEYIDADIMNEVSLAADQLINDLDQQRVVRKKKTGFKTIVKELALASSRTGVSPEQVDELYGEVIPVRTIDEEMEDMYAVWNNMIVAD